MLNLFYEIWGNIRAILLALAIAFVIFSIYMKANAHVIDGIEYIGPGSQAESTMKQAERKENKAAYKREKKAQKHKHDKRSKEQKKSDKQKAAKHMREHGV